jgi:hypothetical protein
VSINWYDRKGKLLCGGSINDPAWIKNMEKVGKLLEDREYKVVGQDRVGRFFVSTVWVGLNHNYGDGPPLIFETMVFDESKKQEYGIGDGKWTSLGEDVFTDRYSTEEGAKAGHVEVLKKYTEIAEEEKSYGLVYSEEGNGTPSTN